MSRLSLAVLTLIMAFQQSPARAGLVEVIAGVKPAVVMVGTHQPLASPQFSLLGTGFAVGDGRRVATAAHVVRNLRSVDGEAGRLVVRGADGATGMRPATVLAMDEAHDLAILGVDGPPIPALPLGEGESVREGRMVAFTGFPIGVALGFTPVTHRGMVSAVTPIAMPSPTAGSLKARVLKRLREGSFSIFQLDATAYPGNSGGPLFDMETGEVLGVINMVVIKGTKEAVLSHPSGISYAVPVQYLRELMAEGER